MIGTSRMEKRLLVPLVVAEQILKAKPPRIMYLCRSGAVTPTVQADGRGSVRQFSADDLFLLAIALQLQDAGLTVKQIAVVNKAFDYLSRERSLRKTYKEHGLVHVIRALERSEQPEQPEQPVLLHVVFSPVRDHPEEMVVYLQAARKLATIPDHSYAFCTSDEKPRRHPARLVLNLTFIRQTIPIS